VRARKCAVACFTFVAIYASSVADSSETLSSPPPSTTAAPEAACTHAKMENENKTPYLPKMRERAIEVRKILCVKGGSREDILNAFALFIDQEANDHWFAPYGGFEGGKDPLLAIRTLLTNNSSSVPTIGMTLLDELEVAGQIYRPASIDQCNAKTANQGCGPILDEFVQYYSYAHNSFASRGAEAFARGVSGLSSQWNTFLNSSRSMTPLELLINSALFKHSETLQFSSPPRVQYIVLHPSVVIENVRAAVGGEKMKEAIMVEVVGVDWWQQDRWYVPTGGSVISLYSDRPGVPEVGYGIAVNFRSVYSIGVTRHGGNGGVFVSFDLFKLLQDKKKVIDSYNP